MEEEKKDIKEFLKEWGNSGTFTSLVNNLSVPQFVDSKGRCLAKDECGNYVLKPVDKLTCKENKEEV